MGVRNQVNELVTTKVVDQEFMTSTLGIEEASIPVESMQWEKATKSPVRTPKEQQFDFQGVGIIVATPSRIMLMNLIKVVLCWICKPRRWCLFLWNNEKHIIGGQKYCHIVLFSKGVHV